MLAERVADSFSEWSQRRSQVVRTYIEERTANPELQRRVLEHVNRLPVA